MMASRASQKCERLTVTFLPSADGPGFDRVPSTLNPVQQSYEWRKGEDVSYMIVPKRISHQAVEVDFFVTAGKKGMKLQPKIVHKAVLELVLGKIGKEWRGLKLASIGRPTLTSMPGRLVVRGSIEDILGVGLTE
jgi:hypothetical protein